MSCKQICIERGYKDNQYIKMMMPVGRKQIPTSLNNVKLSNEASFIFLDIPLIDNEKDFDLFSKAYYKAIKNDRVNCTNMHWADLIGRIFSFRIISFFGELYCQNVDLVLSNIPGPIKELRYNGSIVEKISPIVTPGRGMIFAIVMSYNDHFRINLSIDDKIGIDAKDMLAKVEKALNETYMQ